MFEGGKGTKPTCTRPAAAHGDDLIGANLGNTASTTRGNQQTFVARRSHPTIGTATDQNLGRAWVDAPLSRQMAPTADTDFIGEVHLIDPT